MTFTSATVARIGLSACFGASLSLAYIMGDARVLFLGGLAFIGYIWSMVVHEREYREGRPRRHETLTPDLYPYVVCSRGPHEHQVVDRRDDRVVHYGASLQAAVAVGVACNEEHQRLLQEARR